VIVVDTAPTGHTLRMLKLPQFLDGFLRTIISLRTRPRGLASAMQMFAGGGTGTAPPTVNDALASIEDFQRRARSLRSRLGDSGRTKFVVVMIPTILSVRESSRLMSELVDQGMRVSDVIVNQCVRGGGGVGGGGGLGDAGVRERGRRDEEVLRPPRVRAEALDIGAGGRLLLPLRQKFDSRCASGRVSEILYP